MIHLVLTESQHKSLHVQCFQIADCPNIFFHKREVAQDTHTRGAFMKRTLTTPPPPKKKSVMNYFPKLMVSEHSFSWKSKSPPLSNEFLLDAIQTFQGYQFRFYRKKKITSVWQEISMKSWGIKKLRKQNTGWVTGHLMSTWRTYYFHAKGEKPI